MTFPQDETLEAQIAALTQSVRANRDSLDDATRYSALKAARSLVEALGSPPETVIHDVVMQPALLMSLRMGVQLEAFRAIRDGLDRGITTAQIAKRSGASVFVVDQILRLLSASGYVLETDVQTYKPSSLTMLMADPTFEATTRACFDIGNFSTTYAPEYFQKNNNQFPASAADTPFQLAKDTSLDYFQWLGQHPSLAKDFQQWMTLKQRSTPNWVDWFDVQATILDGLRTRPDEVLLVDVGAGEGHYIHAFNEKFPAAPGRRVLQDLPQVVSDLKDAPKHTELMAHNFFTPQPVKGARAYYMHWILHDWRDEQASDILRNIVAAMEPGYSRLIINDQIIPDRNCDYATACISIMMMVQVGAFERTEKQWRALLTSVGLKDLSFHQPPGGGEGIIVATKE
ncbi:Demethylsterigmatocystin 6-O-methyltransferase [Penicillium ucsense]|uniref:Demethylsterigmatocystin 6-O-methyltransferase n=1 Tax=Penicillium ucsense TaxID=2839758 RepID=A0A8J8VVT3_9EURO|nr:Demethylsterigmatocystin 6-O-methyltransferase [Penicillium ucsense]KAF7733747.1 Demethylsterigmatocystin 6-O-methyltransferase [Penicillium ucsense]